MPSVVAILVALLLIVPLVAFVVWYFRVRRKTTSNMGILSETDGNAANAGDVNQSYENPYFNQEITMSHLQVNWKMILITPQTVYKVPICPRGNLS